jgi:phosphoribosylformylglycinamidine cyclo-ligase
VAITYKDAGVDIAAGEETVRRIAAAVRETHTPNVLNDIGAFGGLFAASFPEMKEPVLVSSVDGVGTKLKVASMCNKHNTIGQDLVNHCVDDILTSGAQPLFFMDYFATGKLDPDVAEQVILGFTTACKENKCALLGGETAEMPGMYAPNEYDVAGTIVGVVEKERILDKSDVRQGDVLIALPSTGLHTNGYSLARAVLFQHFDVSSHIDDLGMTIGESLLAVHRSYYPAVHPLLQDGRVHSVSHITGGGIIGNTSRVVPKELTLQIDWKSWERPAIFELIQRLGEVPEEDMRKTFNLGIGLILICDESSVDSVVADLQATGETPIVIGSMKA